ncbi:MAG: hypothetical protein DHS20C21_06670 [Gemmatimonadota bacterium]|nr:MAG: hypothetical protein DHS20C21_06670 [Gemmatimonadota bacterium]
MSHSGFRVVARFCDGQIVRGHTSDFRPGRATFAVTPPNEASVRVLVDELKALFFVKSLDGNPRHIHDNGFSEEPKVGRRVWVTFQDGEQLAGRAPSVNPENEGFFLFPNDWESNLERAWIVLRSTKSVLYDEDAVEAARQYQPKGPPPSVKHVAPDEWDLMLGFEPPSLKLDGEEQSSPRRRTPPRARPDSGIFLGDW